MARKRRVRKPKSPAQIAAAKANLEKARAARSKQAAGKREINATPKTKGPGQVLAKRTAAKASKSVAHQAAKLPAGATRPPGVPSNAVPYVVKHPNPKFALQGRTLTRWKTKNADYNSKGMMTMQIVEFRH